MTAPKIIAAWQDRNGYRSTLDVDGRQNSYYWVEDAAATRLAQSGQRAIWPTGHGVAAIEDIPKPEPLPKVYLWLSGSHIVASVAGYKTGALVATVTFDADDNATVTRP